jgi:hypothetical protein
MTRDSQMRPSSGFPSGPRLSRYDINNGTADTNDGICDGADRATAIVMMITVRRTRKTAEQKWWTSRMKEEEHLDMHLAKGGLDCRKTEPARAGEGCWKPLVTLTFFRSRERFVRSATIEARLTMSTFLSRW